MHAVDEQSAATRRLATHPAVTGKANQCWACGASVEAAKASFNQNVALRIAPGDAPVDVKICLFCSAECWEYGWPLVRHDFMMVNTAAPK
jgi:hypothetical protein